MSRQSKKHNTWQDHYSRKAKKDQFPARSVYKLEEIQQKYHLLKKGDRVLDLGCAPGSWLLFAARAVGSSGHVVGVDLDPVTITLPTNASVYTGDINDICESDEAPLAQTMRQSMGDGFQVILSDMAADTTGN
ncbi:MAG: RlmE family RNA methyltransferase, partial [Desulfobacterales bacterium]